MKRIMLPTLLILCVVLLLLVVAPATAASRNPFIGKWAGTDLDGSTVRLRIARDIWSAGRIVQVFSADNWTGPWCGGRAKGEALGVPEGEDALAVSFVWWCLEPVENILYFYGDNLTYDASSDTIADSSGVVYHRID